LVRAFWSKRAIYVAPGLAFGLLLSACGGNESTLQKALGYDSNGPDEMAVIKRPPLILPPDFNLRPPRAGNPETAERAASEAARETLIGSTPSAENSTSAAEIELQSTEAASARDILTNGAASTDTAETITEGQNILVNRTDRAERDLDELVETRAENRVDSALLNRLLAWTPEDRPAPAEGDESDTAGEAATTVQVVSRSQSVIDVPSGSDQ